MPGGGIWSPLNTEPWCTVFCRLFDMAPHLGTFLIFMKVSEKVKKMCLPWPRRWAGPCYRMPRYYIHETFRLFLVLLFFYQIWFQMWFAVSLVLTLGYGYPEHRVKRNVIPGLMLVLGVMFYVVCWCGFFGRKQDGSHTAAKRTDFHDRARNQDEGGQNVNNANNFRNNNNNVASGDVASGDHDIDADLNRLLRNRNLGPATSAAVTPPPPPSAAASSRGDQAFTSFLSGAPIAAQSLPNIPNIVATDEYSDDE